MIRFIHCMKKRPELTTAEFREFWNSQEFTDLVNRMAEVTGAISIIKNLTFKIDLNTTLMEERGSEEPYDGILEVWLENASDLEKIQAGGDGEKLRSEMDSFQEKFVDFSASKRFFTEWTPVSGLG